MWITKKTQSWVSRKRGESVRNWWRGKIKIHCIKLSKKLKEKEMLKRLLTQKHTHTFNIKPHAINFLREDMADT